MILCGPTNFSTLSPEHKLTRDPAVRHEICTESIVQLHTLPLGDCPCKPNAIRYAPELFRILELNDLVSFISYTLTVCQIMTHYFLVVLFLSVQVPCFSEVMILRLWSHLPKFQHPHLRWEYPAWEAHHFVSVCLPEWCDRRRRSAIR